MKETKKPSRYTTPHLKQKTRDAPTARPLSAGTLLPVLQNRRRRRRRRNYCSCCASIHIYLHAQSAKKTEQRTGSVLQHAAAVPALPTSIIVGLSPHCENQSPRIAVNRPYMGPSKTRQDRALPKEYPTIDATHPCPCRSGDVHGYYSRS